MRDALEGKRYVEGYVRSLTHEIKSPLSAIRASAELLNEEMQLEDSRRFLANIRSKPSGSSGWSTACSSCRRWKRARA